jgi:hypothetical protein
MCVGSRVGLVGVSIFFEMNFYQLLFTPPPLSGSLYRSFTPPSAVADPDLKFRPHPTAPRRFLGLARTLRITPAPI